ncbi:glycosyl transferase family 1 [Flavobacterium album]|uniref:Glycosyl transferase family 1 n=1 Tax=Flavobacterium album TaxID=2175091 RepID=A0A2S1R2H6_9FLAO|nr:glycosyltransferase [Flavobacterium album]AWH86731.1 glycosyl transferase family 1 [Flavobacterium album]
MRILLIGEYSRLHNSLKEGLVALGHEVTLVGDGDGFKQFPADHTIDAAISKTKLINLPRQVLFRLFRYDIAAIERGLRFYFLLRKLKGYDVVQLINEAPIKTTAAFEKTLLGRLTGQNGKTFLLSCGVDYISVKYMLEGNFRYSLMDPYYADESLLPYYRYILNYIGKKHKKLHDFIFSKISGVIASDMDYVLPMKGHPRFLGLVPNPVNLKKMEYQKSVITDKVVIFLGINRGTYHKKGIPFFEKALEIITQKYGNRTEIIITENIPYNEYINLYNKAHILLDQVYAYDQGYNALEAMAKGKVVFTGAEKEFSDHYGLTEKVAINALPDVDSIVNELSYLIENPTEILAIGKRARAFIEKEHDHIAVAGKYLEKWGMML